MVTPKAQNQTNKPLLLLLFSHLFWITDMLEIRVGEANSRTSLSKLCSFSLFDSYGTHKQTTWQYTPVQILTHRQYSTATTTATLNRNSHNLATNSWTHHQSFHFESLSFALFFCLLFCSQLLFDCIFVHRFTHNPDTNTHTKLQVNFK